MNIYIDQGYTVIMLSNSDSGCVLVLEYLQELTFPSQATPKE